MPDTMGRCAGTEHTTELYKSIQEEAEAARVAARAAVLEADTWRSQAEQLQSQLSQAMEAAEASRAACAGLQQQLSR
jgi:hypothetical protein